MNLPIIYLIPYKIVMWVLAKLAYYSGFVLGLFQLDVFQEFLLAALALSVVAFIITWATVGDKKKVIVLLLLFAASAQARNDDFNWSPSPSVQLQVYRPPEQNIDTYEPEKLSLFRQMFDGALKGAMIENPTRANLAGSVLVNFTPASVAADTRDFMVNFERSAKTNFADYKLATVAAGAGYLPVLGEASKIKGMFAKGHAAGVAASKAAKAGDGFDLIKTVKPLATKGDDTLLTTSRLARTAIAPLKPHHVAAFDGPIEIKLFKKGEVVYRSPSHKMELAREPKRWFGLADVDTKELNEAFYNVEKYSNPNSIMRRYEFKKDTPVYYGKVEGGKGYQIYIPANFNIREVLTWTGRKNLK